MSDAIFAQVGGIPMPANGVADGSAWALYVMGAAVTALASAITYLWKKLEARQSELADNYEKRWEQCEEGHKESQVQVLTLVEKIGNLEGKYQLMESLHTKTLEAVHGRSSGDDKPTDS